MVNLQDKPIGIQVRYRDTHVVCCGNCINSEIVEWECGLNSERMSDMLMLSTLKEMGYYGREHEFYCCFSCKHCREDYDIMEEKGYFECNQTKRFSTVSPIGICSRYERKEAK